MINKGSYNEKMKRKGILAKISYTQLHKIKKTEHIIIDNINKKVNTNIKKNIIKEYQSEHKTNALVNAGESLIVQKYNARPERCEGPRKVSSSPLLINFPINDN